MAVLTEPAACKHNSHLTPCAESERIVWVIRGNWDSSYMICTRDDYNVASGMFLLFCLELATIAFVLYLVDRRLSPIVMIGS